VELSEYILERLHEDGNFILYRGHANRADPSSILLLAPMSAHPTLDTLKRMDHEYSLRGELDAAWAARPVALSRYREQVMLVREDPGGEPLTRLIHEPMETLQFLRIAVGLAAALRALHQRQLIHKDVKPANILVDSVTQREPASARIQDGAARRARDDRGGPGKKERPRSGFIRGGGEVGIPPSTLDHRIKALNIDKRRFRFR
jgi:serine/threonine protein kinase